MYHHTPKPVQHKSPRQLARDQEREENREIRDLLNRARKSLGMKAIRQLEPRKYRTVR